MLRFFMQFTFSLFLRSSYFAVLCCFPIPLCWLFTLSIILWTIEWHYEWTRCFNHIDLKKVHEFEEKFLIQGCNIAVRLEIIACISIQTWS